jgi:hypothetical protein
MNISQSNSKLYTLYIFACLPFTLYVPSSVTVPLGSIIRSNIRPFTLYALHQAYPSIIDSLIIRIHDDVLPSRGCQAGLLTVL